MWITDNDSDVLPVMLCLWPRHNIVVGAVAGCGQLAQSMVQRWKEEVKLG